MKTKKVLLWLLAIVIIVIIFSLYTILASTRSVDQRRKDFDTTFFTGRHPGYEPVLRAAIMKTVHYQKFLKTRNDDSLLIYLKMAEKEGQEAIGKK